MESYGGVDHSFLTLYLDYKWSTLYHGHITQGKESQYTINIREIFQEQIKRVNKNKTYNMNSYNVLRPPAHLPACHIYQILYANYFH